MKKYFISILGICFVLCSQASDVRAVDSNVTYREEISYYGAANIITSQPASVNAKAGDTVHFKVGVNDSRAAYQWQYRLKGESEWKTPGASSARTADYSFSAMEYFDGMSVRCVVTTGSGKLISNEAVLNILKQEEWELPIL